MRIPVNLQKSSGSPMIWFGFLLLRWLLLVCSENSARWDPGNHEAGNGFKPSSPAVILDTHDPQHVILDNGLVKLTLSTPGGMITGIEYGGIGNLLEWRNKETQRGYWDLVWSNPEGAHSIYDVVKGTSFKVVSADENQIEVSFVRTWNSSGDPPINIDKRYIMLRGSPGFYSYAIYEHLEGWPDIDIWQTRLAFKLQKMLFNYMAISDNRQRLMPTADQRAKGQKLAYPEAVLLPHDLPNALLRHEVDDKYQYSTNIKDCHVHGWISSEPRVGFWLITPSNEFRAGGPLKQELTSHVGPTTLAGFFSSHYAGVDMALRLREGETWKKVYGPVFIYLNSNSSNHDYYQLWNDAKEQATVEMRSWPYSFPLSADYPHASERGTVTGRVLVHDRYVKAAALIIGSGASVGLAPEGVPGSWQKDSKGYQFWTQSDSDGLFVIRGVRPGRYNLFYWVPGFIGDSKHQFDILISPEHLGHYIMLNELRDEAGDEINLGDVVYEPPRNGPTLWEIGIPDRTAAEFYVPDPNPSLVNHLYLNNDKFRQYGLWDRYTDLFPENDLVYTIGVSDYKKDWFFAHVNRKLANGGYGTTTWQIAFNLPHVSQGSYTLQLALAAANGARLQVKINGDPDQALPEFRTELFGKDNAIARHGIHGLYHLFSFSIPADLLHKGRNTIFLRQPMAGNKFFGVMYDYIRLEGPSSP